MHHCLRLEIQQSLVGLSVRLTRIVVDATSGRMSYVRAQYLVVGELL
jgi:hypothetical protein